MTKQVDLTDFETIESTSNQQTGSSDDSHSTNSECTSLCELYPEERQSEEWQQLKDEVPLIEPPCGHAIRYLVDSMRPMIRDVSGKKPEYKAGTAEAYSKSLNIFVRTLYDNGISVPDADLDDIDDYLSSRAKLGVAQSTLNVDRAAIKNLYAYLEYEYDVELDFNWAQITKRLQLSSYETSEGKDRENLEKEELQALFDACDDFMWEVVILTAVETGVRCGALADLKLDDIDFDENRINARDMKGNDTRSEQENWLPLTPELGLYLKHWVRICRPARSPGDDNTYVFPSTRGGKISKNHILRNIHQYAQEAGIQEIVGSKPKEAKPYKYDKPADVVSYNLYKVDVHVLRHTFCYLLGESGAPDDVQRKALNHGSLATTRPYQHNKNQYRSLLQDFISNIGNDFSLSRS